MSAASDDFRVELEEFSGPLDLLLYLVRKEEVSIEAFPIARVTEQYLRTVERIEKLDLDRAADYLLMAAQLLEWKARSLLPADAAPAMGEARFGEERAHFVRELLEYRELKERARALEERAAERAKRFGREGEPGGSGPPADARPLKNVDLWDLVMAFERLEKAIGRFSEETVLAADETPLEVFVARLEARLSAAAGPLRFSAVFEGVRTRAALVATFLALLELVRLGKARARQEAPFEEILIEPAG
jgi:segregation and condensation protein A